MFMDRVRAGVPAVLIALALGTSGLAGCASDDDRFDDRGGYYDGRDEFFEDQRGVPGTGRPGEEPLTPGEPVTPGQPEPATPNPFDEPLT